MSAETADTRAANRIAGELVEDAVDHRVSGLALLPEDVEEIDAIATTAISPSTELPFCGIAVLERGTLVEIKSAVRQLSTGSKGRFYLRKRQHERLLDAGASYLFAVVDDSRQLLAVKIVPAVIVDDVVPSWIVSGNGRGPYAQLAWSRVFDDVEVERRGDQ